MLVTRNSQRYWANHMDMVKLPRPKLARINGSCQQNAYASAEVTAPPLAIFSFILISSVV